MRSSLLQCNPSRMEGMSTRWHVRRRPKTRRDFKPATLNIRIQWIGDVLESIRPNPASKTLKELLDVANTTRRGIDTSRETRQQIEVYFSRLQEIGPQGTPDSINGTWKLLWTTEKVIIET